LSRACRRLQLSSKLKAESSKQGTEPKREITSLSIFNIESLVKSLEFVMPDLIRHPEGIEFTG
jgi:hypothetical protein